jgi:hypothetical protein
MRLLSRLPLAVLMAAALCGTAIAQDEKQAPIAFAGGTFTVTETPDNDKILAFDGKELARGYDVSFDRIVKVDGVDTALFNVGPGGNQCGPAKIIAWKPDGGIKSVEVNQNECGAPPAAVGERAIYFVPYVMPGDSLPALQWTPRDGLTTSGNLAYMPEPGTGWVDIDPARYDYIVDAFHNEAVYQAAQKLLGSHLTDMATSLLVGNGTEKTSSGIIYASGCVPHDCGGNDGFMAIDAKGKKLYFARENGNPQPDAWPELKTWPADLRAAMDKAFAPPQ